VVVFNSTETLLAVFPFARVRKRHVEVIFFGELNLNDHLSAELAGEEAFRHLLHEITGSD
jgi:hypothetical protein